MVRAAEPVPDRGHALQRAEHASKGGYSQEGIKTTKRGARTSSESAGGTEGATRASEGG